MLKKYVFLLVFGSISFISSLVLKLDFYKPTILKIHPPICRIRAWLILDRYYDNMIDPHEWDMLMGSSALRDWNILPLSCKPSALTTRPWLLSSEGFFKKQES
jgi:hypothetical protein